MSEREPPGYDDWFDEPEPPTLETGRGNRPSYDAPADTEEDVWVLPEDEQRRARRNVGRGDLAIGGRELTTTQIAILAIAGLAIFVAILAAAGVFSGSTKGSAPPVNSNTTHSTTTGTTKTTPTVVLPTQTNMQLNDTNTQQVKLLQKALTALGYSPGKADGSFGPGTQTAVEDFQNAHGLHVDGIVGPTTLAKMRQLLHGG